MFIVRLTDLFLLSLVIFHKHLLGWLGSTVRNKEFSLSNTPYILMFLIVFFQTPAWTLQLIYLQVYFSNLSS